MELAHLKYINYLLDHKKDFTIRFNKNNKLIMPSIGFIISITPLIKIDMNLNSIVNYVEKNNYIEIFNEVYILYIGGWFEDNSFFPDISIVEVHKEKAINIGKYCNQEAIYDIKNKVVLYL